MSPPKRTSKDMQNPATGIPERDTPDAKRQKRDGYGSISIPIRLKVKVEPLDWKGVCSPVSPSKTLWEESQEARSVVTPQDGNESAPQVLIKKDIFESDSEDSEEEEGEFTQESEDMSPESTRIIKTPTKFSSHEAYRKETRKSPVLDRNSHNAGTQFTMDGKPTATEAMLCFRCKNYGHTRKACKNSWRLHWPQSYVQNNSWIRDKFREIRRCQEARRKGLITFDNFRKVHREIEAEATKREECRKRKTSFQTSERYCNQASSNNPLMRHPPPNRFEQPFPKAHRRLNGPHWHNSNTSSSTSGSPNEPINIHLNPNFNFLALISSMQKQIEDLQASCQRLQLQSL